MRLIWPVELAVAAEHGGAARLSRDGLDGILVIEQREKRRSSDTRVHEHLDAPVASRGVPELGGALLRAADAHLAG